MGLGEDVTSGLDSGHADASVSGELAADSRQFVIAIQEATAAIQKFESATGEVSEGVASNMLKMAAGVDQASSSVTNATADAATKVSGSAKELGASFEESGRAIVGAMEQASAVTEQETQKISASLTKPGQALTNLAATMEGKFGAISKSIIGNINTSGAAIQTFSSTVTSSTLSVVDSSTALGNASKAGFTTAGEAAIAASTAIGTAASTILASSANASIGVDTSAIAIGAAFKAMGGQAQAGAAQVAAAANQILSSVSAAGSAVAGAGIGGGARPPSGGSGAGAGGVGGGVGFANFQSGNTGNAGGITGNGIGIGAGGNFGGGAGAGGVGGNLGGAGGAVLLQGGFGAPTGAGGGGGGAAGLVANAQNIQRLVLNAFLPLQFALIPLKKAYEDAIQTGEAFAQQLHNVDTVIEHSSESIGDIQQNIVKLANDLKVVPLTDLANGLYEIRSANIDASNQFQVLSASAKLGSAGIGTTKGAVNLLTSAINAFKLDTADAELTASKFLTAIQVGKVTVEQYANAFGRVSPIAAQAGVSLNEVLAATAALSLTGKTVPQTQTDIKQAIVGLLKPSADLVKVYHDLNVAGGEDLIKSSGGLVNALVRIKDAVGGSTTEVSKLFNNINAFNAISSLAGNQLSVFRETLAKIDATGVNNLNDAFSRQVDVLKEHKEATEAAKVALFDGMQPALYAVLTPLNFLLRSFSEADPVLKTLIGTLTIVSFTILSVAVSLGGLLLAVAGLAPIIATAAAGTGAAAVTIGVLAGALEFLGVVILPIIAILGTAAIAHYALRDSVLDASKAIQDKGVKSAATAQTEAALARSTENLTTEYVSLKDELADVEAQLKKTNLKHAEAEDLNKRHASVADRLRQVLDKVAATTPEVVDGFDAQGRAMSLNIDIAHRLAEAHRQNAKAALDDARAQRSAFVENSENLKGQRDQLSAQLNLLEQQRGLAFKGDTNLPIVKTAIDTLNTEIVKVRTNLLGVNAQISAIPQKREELRQNVLLPAELALADNPDDAVAIAEKYSTHAPLPKDYKAPKPKLNGKFSDILKAVETGRQDQSRDPNAKFSDIKGNDFDTKLDKELGDIKKFFFDDKGAQKYDLNGDDRAALFDKIADLKGQIQHKIDTTDKKNAGAAIREAKAQLSDANKLTNALATEQGQQVRVELEKIKTDLKDGDITIQQAQVLLDDQKAQLEKFGIAVFDHKANILKIVEKSPGAQEIQKALDAVNLTINQQKSTAKFQPAFDEFDQGLPTLPNAEKLKAAVDAVLNDTSQHIPVAVKDKIQKQLQEAFKKAGQFDATEFKKGIDDKVTALGDNFDQARVVINDGYDKEISAEKEKLKLKENQSTAARKGINTEIQRLGIERLNSLAALDQREAAQSAADQEAAKQILLKTVDETIKSREELEAAAQLRRLATAVTNENKLHEVNLANIARDFENGTTSSVAELNHQNEAEDQRHQAALTLFTQAGVAARQHLTLGEVQTGVNQAKKYYDDQLSAIENGIKNKETTEETADVRRIAIATKTFNALKALQAQAQALPAGEPRTKALEEINKLLDDTKSKGIQAQDALDHVKLGNIQEGLGIAAKAVGGSGGAAINGVSSYLGDLDKMKDKIDTATSAQQNLAEVTKTFGADSAQASDAAGASASASASAALSMASAFVTAAKAIIDFGIKTAQEGARFIDSIRVLRAEVANDPIEQLNAKRQQTVNDLQRSTEDLGKNIELLFSGGLNAIADHQKEVAAQIDIVNKKAAEDLAELQRQQVETPLKIAQSFAEANKNFADQQSLSVQIAEIERQRLEVQLVHLGYSKEETQQLLDQVAQTDKLNELAKEREHNIAVSDTTNGLLDQAVKSGIGGANELKTQFTNSAKEIEDKLNQLDPTVRKVLGDDRIKEIFNASNLQNYIAALAALPSPFAKATKQVQDLGLALANVEAGQFQDFFNNYKALSDQILSEDKATASVRVALGLDSLEAFNTRITAALQKQLESSTAAVQNFVDNGLPVASEVLAKFNADLKAFREQDQQNYFQSLQGRQAATKLDQDIQLSDVKLTTNQKSVITQNGLAKDIQFSQEVALDETKTTSERVAAFQSMFDTLTKLRDSYYDQWKTQIADQFEKEKDLVTLQIGLVDLQISKEAQSFQVTAASYLAKKKLAEDATLAEAKNLATELTDARIQGAERTQIETNLAALKTKLHADDMANVEAFKSAYLDAADKQNQSNKDSIELSFQQGKITQAQKTDALEAEISNEIAFYKKLLTTVSAGTQDYYTIQQKLLGVTTDYFNVVDQRSQGTSQNLELMLESQRALGGDTIKVTQDVIDKLGIHTTANVTQSVQQSLDNLGVLGTKVTDIVNTVTTQSRQVVDNAAATAATNITDWTTVVGTATDNVDTKFDTATTNIDNSWDKVNTKVQTVADGISSAFKLDQEKSLPGLLNDAFSTALFDIGTSFDNLSAKNLTPVETQLQRVLDMVKDSTKQLGQIQKDGTNTATAGAAKGATPTTGTFTNPDQALGANSKYIKLDNGQSLAVSQARFAPGQTNIQTGTQVFNQAGQFAGTAKGFFNDTPPDQAAAAAQASNQSGFNADTFKEGYFPTDKYQNNLLSEKDFPNSGHWKKYGITSNGAFKVIYVNQYGVGFTSQAISEDQSTGQFATDFQYFNSGGIPSIVPGFGNQDTVKAKVTPGELIIPKDVTKQLLSRTGTPVPALGASSFGNLANALSPKTINNNLALHVQYNVTGNNINSEVDMQNVLNKHRAEVKNDMTSLINQNIRV